ncbi:MAG: hypothetical protein KAQ98_01825 [Bacteriovoracaceae bacterium]|nr:hypothetical protein [Bacteriovoracaceae bacterium]
MFARSKKPVKKESFRILHTVKKILFHSQGFPIFLVCAVLAILFVLFRMKVVEINYGIHSLNEKTSRTKLEHKGLSAKKARLLSVKNLQKIAKKYKLSQPKRKQIIVIPK